MPNVFGIVIETTPAQVITGGSDTAIVDAAGAQRFELQTGAMLSLSASSGTNSFVLPGNAGDYTIQRDFAEVTVSGPNGEQLTFQARGELQTLIFDDGTADVRIDGNDVLVGSQSIPEDAPASVTTTLGAAPTPAPAPTSPADSTNYFGIVTGTAPEQVISAGSNAEIVDASGAQSFAVAAGASLNLSATNGANTITLSGTSDEFQISQDFGAVTLTGPNGETVSFAARTTAQTLVFDDGQAGIRIDGNSVVLGDQTVTGTPAPVDLTGDGGGGGTGTTQAIGPGDDGSTFDATTDDFVFDFADGNYAVTIDGFASGDVLDIADVAGSEQAAVTVQPDTGMQTDGTQVILFQNVDSGDEVTLTLTGLTGDQDSGVFNVGSIDTVFGDGTLIA